MIFDNKTKNIYPKLSSDTLLLKKMFGYLADAIETDKATDRKDLVNAINSSNRILRISLKEIIVATSKKYILPIDREDIHALVSSLIYLNDYVNTCAIKLLSYKIDTYRLDEIELTVALKKIISPLTKAIIETEHISNGISIVEYCNQIKLSTVQCLHDIDGIIIKLFEVKTDSLEVIKHLELLKAFTTLTKQIETTRRILLNTVIKFT